MNLKLKEFKVQDSNFLETALNTGFELPAIYRDVLSRDLQYKSVKITLENVEFYNLINLPRWNRKLVTS